MSSRRFILSVLTCFGVFGGVLCAQCNSNDSSAPCFANNSDILNGRNSLLQDDDLMMVGAFGGFNSAGAIALTQNSQISSLNVTNLANTPRPASTPTAIAARLFSEKSEQVVSAASNTAGTVFLNPDSLPVPPMPVVSNALQVLGVAADFLGTGFDQVVLMALKFNSPVTQLVFQGLTAVDPYQPASGLKVGPLSSPVNNASSVYAIAAGVFTDPVLGFPSPRPQIVVYSSDPSGKTVNGVITFYAVDANLHVAPTGQSLTVSSPLFGPGFSLWSVSLAAGRFTGGTHDQLVASYGYGLVGHIGMSTVDFSSQGAPLLKNNTSINPKQVVLAAGNVYGGAVNVTKGHFDWFSAADQVAFSYFQSDEVQYAFGQPFSVQVVSFDANMTPAFGSPYLSTNGCPMGLAVGRFDQMQANPNPPPPQQPNPNLQIAQFVNGCNGNNAGANFLALYDVNPANNFAITPHPLYPIPTSIFSSAPTPYNTAINLNSPPTPVSIQIVAADIQGRSLPLGPPSRATVSGHIQPDTVLEVPPMHVDWITPAGETTPEVLNVSVFPATFNTAYTFSSGSNASVTRSGTTSYTASTKVTANEKVSYGVPGIASVSVQATQAASQLHKNTVAKKYNTYSGQTMGFSTSTIFDDVVAATASQFNIFNYRVIGQCVTAPNAPGSEGCAAGTEPLYIQFSGPDNVNYIQAAEGRNLEWYQPVEEPGNIFSYPANQAQLQADIAGGNGFQALTPTNNLWDSQTSAAVTANWTQGEGNSVSSGSVSTHSFDASVSVSAGVSFDGFGASGGLGFDYNQSSSTSTLNQSTSSFSSSQGIKLNRGVGGGPISSAVYDYQGQSVIYGQTAPQGTIQTDITTGTTVETQGYIAAAHMVDMLSQGAINSGNFWAQAYSAAPDVSLNHPQRWLQKTPSGVNPQQVQFNCPIGFSSSLSSPSCTPNSQTPTPANVADANFYQIKGLFVTPGDTTEGPQISTTTLGNKVNLRVRVYNYSLKNFLPTSILHVQFYAQPWGIGQFASDPNNPNAFAQAVFIGNATDAKNNQLLPVPAFCGGFTGGGDPCIGQGSTVRNWEYAYATWDTSKGNIAANSMWKFWVVVWVETNGTLATELPGHGLTSRPLTPFNSLADVPVEAYSNNLGYYNQVFTVLPAAGITGTGRRKKIAVGDINPRNGARVLRDVPITITASHIASGDKIDSVLALYYDGNPKKGGTLFDTQHISRVQLAAPYLDTASYTAPTCGRHTIFVQSIPLDGTAPVATGSKKIDVTIDPVESVEELISYVRHLSLSVSLKNELLGRLDVANRAFQRGNEENGREKLKNFEEVVRKNKRQIPDQSLDAILDHIRDMFKCMREDRGNDDQD